MTEGFMEGSVVPIPRQAIEDASLQIQIADQLEENFKGRGNDMAYLLKAALTETPHVPVIKGEQYQIIVGSPGVEGTENDNVVVAKTAIEQALAADVPGMNQRSLLTSFDTMYRTMAKRLRPKRSDGRRNIGAFEEAFVESVRGMGVDIPDPKTGFMIIRGAPRTLSGLQLTRDVPGPLALRESVNDNVLITTGGRKIFYSTYRYGHDSLSSEPRRRKALIPGMDIATEIGQRVTKLRTAGTRK